MYIYKLVLKDLEGSTVEEGPFYVKEESAKRESQKRNRDNEDDRLMWFTRMVYVDER